MNEKMYKDFLKSTMFSNKKVDINSFENICFSLADNGFQHIIDDVHIEKALEDIEKGYVVANSESFFIAYYKKIKTYYFFNSDTGEKGITSLDNIKRHIKSDAYEIQRYFKFYLDTGEF